MILDAFAESRLRAQMEALKPSLRWLRRIQASAVLLCTLAGLAWERHPLIGALINLVLSVAVFVVDDIRLTRRARELARLDVIARARAEFGLMISDNATIEEVGQLVVAILPLRTQPRAEA